MNSSLVRGMCLMAAAIFLLTAMDMLAKILVESDVHTVTILAIRSVVITTLLLAALSYQKRLSTLRTQRLGAHIARGMVGLTAVGGFFTALAYLPLADAQVVFFTGTLFIAIASVVVLKERFGVHRWLAVAAGYIGVAIAANPSLDGMSIGYLFALLGSLSYAALFITEIEGLPMQDNQFDYIIIGAGSAGCVLANRLSENPQRRVLLLEAGNKDHNPSIHVPAGIADLLGNASVDWCFKTTAQPALNNRQIDIPRGKTLGGSSSINAMVYIRGQREDYDQWRDLGNPGWGYEDVLPYFIKSENNSGKQLDKNFHGHGGPLSVSDRRYTNPLSDAFVSAAEQAGLSRNNDFNGETQQGVGRYQVTHVAGRRCSAAVAYLKPARRRSNLTIVTNAHASKVLLEGTRATGVEYLRNGKTHTAHAKKEVILSAGAIASPQLLMLSGIGEAEQLAAHGIQCEHVLAGVGKNLYDHLNISVLAFSKQDNTLESYQRGLQKGLAAIRYLATRNGPANSNAAESGGFYATALSDGRADIQFHFLPIMVYPPGCADTGRHGVTLHACHLRPTDVGEIRLADANPLSAPLIDNQFLQREGNLAVMREGLKIARKILSSQALADHLAEEYCPGSSVQSDEQLDAYIRAHAETEFHPVGTCKMGQDDLAVVDAECRVHGLQNLRVVDASIMPTLISGNTNAPCMMIGEKASDLILAAH
eukprot:maker-scaffold7610_size3089-snap-gene-0.2 protein:Tk05708 transcript:maker-scaffold7610_size3089-snap-gene-0.2-mRNA-1 annotation:"choline dehydrogenase"